MAGTFSHFKFMEDLSVNLGFDKPKELFLIAGQGHDLLFFIKLRELNKIKKELLKELDYQEVIDSKVYKKKNMEYIKEKRISKKLEMNFIKYREELLKKNK